MLLFNKTFLRNEELNRYKPSYIQSRKAGRRGYCFTEPPNTRRRNLYLKKNTPTTGNEERNPGTTKEVRTSTCWVLVADRHTGRPPRDHASAMAHRAASLSSRRCLENRLSGELQLPIRHAEALHVDPLAFLHETVDVADALRVQLGDVHQTLEPREFVPEAHEDAEVFYADDLALPKDPSLLGERPVVARLRRRLGGHLLDEGLGLLHFGHVEPRDGDGTLLTHVEAL
mmetsp:Transcript_10459/g.27698  ORF Transcript_10459/g.27698 Transcript_10459/m.27698 type:complete len:229 (-) Transcript_10459:2063-2749(-)